MRLNPNPMVWLAGCLALTACADQKLTTTNSFTTTRNNLAFAHLVPQLNFSMQDVIRVEVFLSWPDPDQDDGVHDVDWKWYRDGVLVSHAHRDDMEFRSTPFNLWSGRAAASLGPGHYRVDTLVDGNVIASDPFTINPT